MKVSIKETVNLKGFDGWGLDGQEEVEYQDSCQDTQERDEGGEGEQAMTPRLAVQVCCICQLCLELFY